MKPRSTKITLCILILLTGIFDFATFYFGKLYQFEINPIYIISGSIWTLFAVKFVVLGLLIYLIMYYKPKKRHIWSFINIFSAVFIIITQILGGISNLEASNEYKQTVGTPNEIQPMETSQAIQTFAYLHIIFYYLPLFISLLSFAVWERIYL